MTHRYQVGQTLSVRGAAILPGPFRIVRLLPLSESGVPQYRVTSIADGHDRVFPETAVRLLASAATSDTASPVRKTGRSWRGESNERSVVWCSPPGTLLAIARRASAVTQPTSRGANSSSNWVAISSNEKATSGSLISAAIRRR